MDIMVHRRIFFLFLFLVEKKRRWWQRWKRSTDSVEVGAAVTVADDRHGLEGGKATKDACMST